MAGTSCNRPGHQARAGASPAPTIHGPGEQLRRVEVGRTLAVDLQTIHLQFSHGYVGRTAVGLVRVDQHVDASG